jgi:hypothetical protein
MEVFSPVGAYNVNASIGNKSAVADSSPADVLSPKSSAFRPSALRNTLTADDKSMFAPSSNTSKKSFPLMERLQSAIKTLEERSDLSATSNMPRESESPSVPEFAANVENKAIDRINIQANIPKPLGSQLALQGTISQETNIDYAKIEKMIEAHSRRLHDQLQNDLHSLHMDMLKQSLAVQKHQEQLLHMYLPQVKELVEELKTLRDENSRLRARLHYQ